MKTIKTLDYKDAKKAMAAIEIIAEKMSLKLSVCITDSAGNTILHIRMDGARIPTFDLAKSKAYTAVCMQNSSGSVHKIIKEYGIELADFDGSVKTGLKGGVPAFSPDDKDNPIGAIGVSGGSEDQDEEIAIGGLKAIGFYKEVEV